MALKKMGVDKVHIRHKPRLLSDNSPCYLSKKLGKYFTERGIKHTRGSQYHPMIQGKNKRYYKLIKNVINLQNYYFPWELEKEIKRFVNYYNNHKYNESLNNLTPADVYCGRSKKIISMKENIKRKTTQLRKIKNLGKSSTRKT